MKRNILTLVLILVILSSCEDNNDLCLTGSGTLREYELSLSSFDGIALEGPVNLRFRQGAVQQVTVYAEPELFAPLEYEVRSGTLEIGYRNNVRCFNSMHGVWVDVTVPSLESISLSGQGVIENDQPIDQSSIAIVVSGDAEVRLTGKVEFQQLVVSGEIVVHNFDLASEHTGIVVSGSGEFDVDCSETLDINVSGAAVVRYTGSPRIEQDVSGSLQLIDAN